jgi:hypothetical protein
MQHQVILFTRWRIPNDLVLHTNPIHDAWGGLRNLQRVLHRDDVSGIVLGAMVASSQRVYY